ncbi:hypothetical protein EH183_38780 [Streptomyces sp. CB01881]|uniref:hypothetical protein n=1 Tax=Streptomyces sp. CB01881 TaxID=2078691 RepID=UPI0011DFC096|nr:hypothetical protein [Streptomyces sp. CB01881]TYC68799.1 hypothetical protein EH183_38780 [Streptomyces sp. CB01881]
MTTPAEPGAGFESGTTVVRRDIHAGKVWSAQPHRAPADTGTVLELACWPGIRSLAPTTWTTALRTGDDALRKNGLARTAGRARLEADHRLVRRRLRRPRPLRVRPRRRITSRLAAQGPDR